MENTSRFVHPHGQERRSSELPGRPHDNTSEPKHGRKEQSVTDFAEEGAILTVLTPYRAGSCPRVRVPR
eukprot:6628133-Prymnesium_polylepis.1